MSIVEAAEAMGYKGADMLYRILRNEERPSLERLQKLADRINEPIGDLLPNSGTVIPDNELRDVLAAISGVSNGSRDEIVAALAVNARVMANAFRKAAAEVVVGKLVTEVAKSAPDDVPSANRRGAASEIGRAVKRRR